MMFYVFFENASLGVVLQQVASVHFRQWFLAM
jgi:hypothetical protein